MPIMESVTTIDSMTAQSLHDHKPGYSLGDLDGFWEYIADQDEGDSRWHHNHLMVIRDPDGQHWGLRYRIGLTEEQENEYPWDGSNERLELLRLYRHEVRKVEYRTEPAEVTA